MAMCVELDTGRVAWEERNLHRTEIASPVLVDGKLLYICLDGIGGDNVPGSLLLIEATLAAYRLLGKAEVRASACTTPAVVDGMAYVRMPDKVVCYDLRKRAQEGRSTDSSRQK